MIILTKDDLRSSIEAATGGNVTVLYDDKGYPSYMAVIPKFTIESVFGSSDYGSGIHPAFIVNGIERSEIFIGQYEAMVVDGRACSLPGQPPITSVDFDQAKAYCSSKGSNWHLMTNWEWAAIALWCLKNGFQPRGNTNYGQAYNATYETGLRIDGGAPGDTSGQGSTKTGSGPASWRHNNTFSGISNLVGNIYEWIDGFKIVDGKMYMPSDNNYSLDDESYPEVLDDQNPQVNVKFDSTDADDGNGGSSGHSIISDTITNVLTTGYNTGTWKSISIKEAYTPPDILYQACIVPFDTDNPVGSINIKNYGERMLRRGGSYAYGSGCGLFAMSLNLQRDATGSRAGFRPVFIA